MGLNEFSLMLRALTYTHIQHFLLTALSSYLHTRPEIDTLFSLFVCVCVCVSDQSDSHGKNANKSPIMAPDFPG